MNKEGLFEALCKNVECVDDVLDYCLHTCDYEEKEILLDLVYEYIDDKHIDQYVDCIIDLLEVNGVKQIADKYLKKVNHSRLEAYIKREF